MWAGTSVLQSINQTLATVRNESLRLDSQLASLTESLATNQRQKLAIVNQIAAIRLSEIERGELDQSLNNADRQVLETLELRKQALVQLNSKIDRLNNAIIKVESDREKQLDRVNELSQQLFEIETDVQNALKADSTYLAQFELANNANAMSHEAERKVAQAQADMSAKAKPYEQDALFMYLWNRGFGTTEYKGRSFARMLDSWVAELINYEGSRVNFWNLTEIPKRLTEHAEQVADVAEKEHDALQKLELNALEAAGMVKLEAKIEAARHLLDEFDDEIESKEIDLNDSLAKRAEFTAGQDTYMRKSLNRLAEALKHQNLASIHRYVRATNSPTDDKLVIELQYLQDAVDDVNENLEDVRSLHSKQLTKLTELESVRRNFKNARYDDVRSGFSNQSLVVSVLGQFVQGLVDGTDVWQTIKRNQRYRNTGASPDFGSGALGGIGEILVDGAIDYATRRQRKSRNSSWNLPRSRRSNDTAYRRPRAKRSSGGFQTGGGF